MPQTPNLTTHNVQGFSVSFFLPYLLYSFHSSMDLVPFLASMNLFSLRVGRENQEANAGLSLVGGGKYKPWNTYKSTHFYPVTHDLPSSWLCDPLYWIGTERFIPVATVSRGNGGGRPVGRHKYLFAFEPLFSRLCLNSRINFFFWWWRDSRTCAQSNLTSNPPSAPQQGSPCWWCQRGHSHTYQSCHPIPHSLPSSSAQVAQLVSTWVSAEAPGGLSLALPTEFLIH